MKKSNAKEFTEFMLDEAMKFGREIQSGEIANWFEHFTLKRVTFDDFKLAWVQHKRDERWGGRFPSMVDLERLLRKTGDEQAVRDWRCIEEIDTQRCGYPGGIKAVGGPGWQCSAHYRLWTGGTFSKEASLQIIETSAGYAPPKNSMELMERGEKQRREYGERMRKALGIVAAKRLEGDEVHPKVPARGREEADAHVASADAVRMEEINRALAMAQQAAE